MAVDGRLITTREAGRHLANLPVGREVTLVVRGPDGLKEKTVLTHEGCDIRSLSVRSSGE